MRSIEQVSVSRPVSPPVPARPVARGRTMLTRRGRLVVHGGASLLLVLLGLLSLLAFTGTAEAGDAPHPVPVTYHEVLPGETLWGIAAAHDPSSDRRDTIAEIVSLNALPSQQLSAGQRIALPL